MWFESAHVEVVRDTFPEWMALVFAAISHLGSVWFVAPAVVLAFWFGDRRQFASWVAIVMGGYAIMVGLKGAFETPRPGVGPAIAPEALPTIVAVVYAPAVEVSSASFPSGHAIAATVIWTMLAIELDIGTRRMRAVGAATMIGLVALARVGVGVHYPIDVAVGVLVSTTYLGLILGVRSWLRARRPHVETSAMFAVCAGLSLWAFWIGGRPDALALCGGCLGGLLAWQHLTPPRRPWPKSARGAGSAFCGLGLLTLVALVLVVVDIVLVWLLVGVGGGLTLVGLPRLFVACRQTLTGPLIASRDPSS